MTKYVNCIHPEQGAFLGMCHFDDVLDPCGIYNLCLIDSVLSDGGGGFNT